MAKLNRAKKDKFEELDSDFRDSVSSMGEQEIRDRIAQTALDQMALMKAKEEDYDLKRLKEEAREAGAAYREGSRRNKLKIEFCRRVLGDKGKRTGGDE